MILDAILQAALDPAPLPEPTVVAAGVVAGEREPRPDRAQVSRIVEAASIVPARWRPFARCLVARESHGNPQARNPHSSAQGIAQWLDRSWRYGLAHRVAVRLHEHGMTWPAALAVRDWLRGKEIATWPEAYQWIGLASSLDDGNWTPWRLAGSSCNGLVAS